MSASKSLVSPRIAALQDALASHQVAALTTFWQEVTENGTPLIERIPEDEEYSLVTFLWRGMSGLQNVVILDGIAGENFAANQLSRLSDTDVWYKTYRARNDTRTTYVFSLNDPLLAEGDEGWAAHVVATFQADPLNTTTLLGDSVLKLPDAPPEPWIVPQADVPTGQLDKHHLYSESLRNQRDIWVYTPPHYSHDTTTYGWILLFDGGAYVALPTPTILDNLIGAQRIPPIIAIFVGNVSQAVRTSELTCNPHFASFITQELLPWIRQNYHISDDASRVAVGGASYGGLAATYLAFNHPELFGNVLSQSGGFWWAPDYTPSLIASEPREYGWLIRQFVQTAHLPLRFHIEVGMFETSTMPGGVYANILRSDRHMRDVLEAKGYPVRYVEFGGGHDFVGWRSNLPDALIWLFDPG